MNSLSPEYIEIIRKQINDLPDDSSPQKIEETAQHLETITYQPMLMVEPPDFLRITKQGLLSFIDELVANQKGKELTEQHLNLLLHHFKLLQRLRRNEPEAWDEITEVMEED